MHSETIPTTAPGGHRMRGVGPQGDGRKPLPHIVTSLLTLVLTLVVGHYSAILQGQQGPPGLTKVITKPYDNDGLCVYIGSGSSITSRVKISSPRVDASGPWCPVGHLVSVVVPQK